MACTSLHFAVVCVMLMLRPMTSFRQFLNPDELPAVKSMCDAQCEMLCLEIGQKCQDVCGDYDKTYRWKLNCSYEGDCMNQGYCATLEKYSHGYVPQKPIINVERDLLARTLTVRWTKIPSSHRIIYVLQYDQTILTTRLVNGPPMQIKSDKINWVTLGWAASSYFIFANFADICLRPKFRVAAVSQFGSRWFTEAVQTPEMVPGQATNISASDFVYHRPGEVSFHLTWDNPPGWRPSDVLLYEWTKGPSTCPDALVFFDNPRTLQSRQMTVRISENGIGCTFNFQIQVVSRCSPNLRGPMKTFEFELDCKTISNYTCKPPVYDPPGNVDQINIRVIPTNNGPIIQLNWQPPTDLGSVGIIGQYNIRWGVLDQDSFDRYLKIGSLYNTHTFSVPGTQLWTQIKLGKVNGTEIYGVQIMPSAPGHGIKYWVAPINSMPVVPADWPVQTSDRSSHIPSPHIIKDDNGVIIVLVPIHPHPSVRLFLNMPEEQFDDEVEGFAVRWGHTKQTEGSPEISIDVLNSTYIPKNVSTIDIVNLHPKKDYGIKVVAVYKQNDTSESPWDKAVVHRFTMPEQTDSGEAITVNNTRHRNTGNDKKVKIISLLSLGIAVIFIVPVVFYIVRKRRKKLTYLEDRGPVADAYRHYTEHGPTGYRLDTSALLTPTVVPDKWELPHSSLRFGQMLGTGAFGLVLKGQMTATMLLHRGVAIAAPDDRAGMYVTVAIKLLQESCDGSYRVDFLKEIALMKNIGYHVNVVSMLGCCTLCDPICLVVEHMSRGDLLRYLKNIRHSLQQESVCAPADDPQAKKLTYLDLLSFARQIAKGMEFLSQKGFVHRDLAARNVLVGSDNTLKIGDFGLTRYIYDDKVYINRRGGKLPLKWMSIESIFERTYSTASDVWSYGVMLFEIFTLGGTPYPTVPNRDLLMELQHGYRMEKPENCSDEIYQLMLSCWKENPRCRPDFTELCLQVEAMMDTCSANNYLDLTLNVNPDYYTIESESDVTSTSENHSQFDDESETDMNSCSRDDDESHTDINSCSRKDEESHTDINSCSRNDEESHTDLNSCSRDDESDTDMNSCSRNYREFDEESHTDMNASTQNETKDEDDQIDVNGDGQKMSRFSILNKTNETSSDSENTDVKVFSIKDTSDDHTTSEMQNNIANICCKCEEIHQDSIESLFYPEDILRENVTSLSSMSTEDILRKNVTSLSSMSTEDILSENVTSLSSMSTKDILSENVTFLSSMSTEDVLMRESKPMFSITSAENDYERSDVTEHCCRIADKHLILNDGMKENTYDHDDLRQDVTLEVTSGDLRQDVTLEVTSGDLRQDVTLEVTSESSDSNIDWDDVFTDDDDEEEDDNHSEFLTTLKAQRRATSKHFPICPDDTSAVQTDWLVSVTSAQYLVPVGDEVFTRTESVVSTTSIDSGFPQSPIQKDQTFCVAGLLRSGKYKKAAKSRLCSNGGVQQKLKRKKQNT